jgi:predicted HicB family RNase H-like nuclease
MYKGYEADVEFDGDAGIFHGEVVNTPHDVITFQGTSVDELTSEFHRAVDDYLDWCASEGASPESPLPDEITLRVPPDVRRKLMLAAKRQAMSVEAYIAQSLSMKMMTGGSSS